MPTPFLGSTRTSVVLAALVFCLHLQGAEAFSSLVQLRSPLDTALLNQLKAKAPSASIRSAVSGLRARASLGGRLLRTDAAALSSDVGRFGSSFVKKIGRFDGEGDSSTSTSLKGWVGTGVFLYSKWQISFGLNSVLAGLLFLSKKYQKMLTTAGLFHAWILGVILWGSLGPGGWATGAFYLAAGSRVTKLKMAEKEAAGIAEGRGGARGPENVWGSAATAAICALLAALSPWDAGIFKLGFVASLATKLSDTFASEVGKAYGKTTYLITSMERVEPGTEGAISLEGTLAGVVGSLILALFGLLAHQIFLEGVLFCLVAAFVATTAESYIGATFQGKIPWMTNEVVNFINTTIGAAVAMAMYAFFL